MCQGIVDAVLKKAKILELLDIYTDGLALLNNISEKFGQTFGAQFILMLCWITSLVDRARISNINVKSNHFICRTCRILLRLVLPCVALCCLVQ